MARPREVRGWFVYGVGVSVAFLMLAFRLHYATAPAVSPSLVFPFVDVPFVIGVLAVALAALGLHQGLWYLLVKPGGWLAYVASLFMFGVALLFFYALPGHLATRNSFLLIFAAALLQFLYVPALSYGSKVFLGIAIGGEGVLVLSVVLAPVLPVGLAGAAHLSEPVVLATVVAQGLLLLTLLRLLQMTFQPSGVSAA